MTSILDQYEQATQKYSSAYVSEAASAFSHNKMELQDEAPIFSKQKMQFSPSDRITHLAVANDFLVLAMANNTLFRIDLKQPDKNDEIPMNKQTHRISDLFIDPIGNHLLIAMTAKQADSASELIYLHRKSNKLKASSKFRGYEITQVGWNYENYSETTTGHILLGTSKGLIFESEMGLDGDKIFHSGLEQYWRQVFDIGKGSDVPITGLEFHKISDMNKYIILVTTPQKLYQFSGTVLTDDKTFLQQIFNTYLNKPEECLKMRSSLKYSRLKLFYGNSYNTPKSFGWLMESGLYYADFNLNNKEDQNFITNNEMLLFPPHTFNEATSSKKVFPINFVLTQFHALLVYNDRVQGISLLNNDLIFEDIYNENFGKLLNMARDPKKGTIWSFTDKAVFRYKVSKEERDVWKIYAEKNEFSLAKKYCNDNPEHLDKIHIKEAELLFENKKYKDSALIFAETHSSFEGVCLKFLECNEIPALRLFLRKKLERMSSQDKTQITMVIIWIIELYLNEIGNLRNQNLLDSPECHSLQMEFEKFIKIPFVYENICNNKKIIYELMASHGDNANLIKLTMMNEDFENVIETHLYKGQYLEALEILKRQHDNNLLYKHCPILMEEIPQNTVNLLISRGKHLQPFKLLPALVGASSISDTHMTEIIKYLEFCVHSVGSTQQAIHNYLLTLYVNNYPKKLMQYLATQGQDITMIHYDVHYALRLCREKHLIEACVQLSALLGLWEAAVDLALTVSLDLAKATASQPNLSDEQRRMLWLKIAKHVLSGKDDIEKAMEFLNQCDLIKIEDLLPFFSDFVTIDHFKDAICNSLEKYNQKIRELKEDMEEATQSAEQVRKEIVSFRNRAAIVTIENTCELCNITLLIRPFYLFPCGHKFHSDCLQSEITPHLATTKRNKLMDLQRQLTALQSNTSDSASHGSASISMKQHIKEDIDLIIASDCWLCGEFMIQSLDKPFINEDEWDTVAKDWE